LIDISLPRGYNAGTMNTKKPIRYVLPMLFIAVAVTGLFFLGGCTSMDKELLQDPKNFEELEPLKLEAGIEPYDLRIDVKRQTREEKTAGLTESRSMTMELPYTPIGFNIGNGIFVDTNFNICLDVLELYGIDELEDFSISRTYANTMVKPQRFVKEGDRFILTAGSAGNKKLEAKFQDDAIEIIRSPGSNYEIVEEDGELAIVPLGVIKAIETHTISGEEDDYRVKKPLKKIYVTTTKEGVSFGDYFTAAIKGNMMIFTFLNRDQFRLVRIQDDYYFFDKSYIGFKVSREGNTISVTEKSREEAVFVHE
jgi:hypothetical protein